MLYKHHKNYEGEWRWANFSLEELSCPCCGEYWHDPKSLDMIQAARTSTGKAYTINSAHRCTKHNKAVHGAPNSEHLRIAFDISLHRHDKEGLLRDLFEAGFTTFGLYNTFIHTDKRSWRKWINATGAIKRLWRDIYNRVVKADD